MVRFQNIVHFPQRYATYCSFRLLHDFIDALF